jgi:hypothetical protein
MSPLSLAHQALPNLRSKRIGISLETLPYSVVPIILVFDVVETAVTVALVTELPVGETITIPETERIALHLHSACRTLQWKFKSCKLPPS